MSVAPNSREDDQNAGFGPAIRSSTLPPVLFRLPNLSASECGTASDDDAVMQEPTANEHAPLANPPEPQTPQSVGPVPATPVPPTQSVSAEISEATANPTPEPVAAKQNGESLFDIWGTRAVVVALLMLVIGTAFVAARKTRDQSAPEAAVDAGVSMDDIEAMENFAVSEGVEVADVAVTVDHQELEFASTDDVGSTTTLAEPIVAQTNDLASTESPSTQAFDATNNNAAFGPAAQVPAWLASNRTETSELPIEALQRADLESPAADQAPTDEAASIFSGDADLTPAVDSVATRAAAGPAQDIAADTNPVVDNTDAIQYSSTPNWISDWTQYLPAVPTTTAPQTP